MNEFECFIELVKILHAGSVRFVLIGVAGVNYYARSARASITTQDRDLLLPPDPENELRAWNACIAAGLSLSCGREPLGAPLDLELAGAIVSRGALVQATNGRGLDVDLTLVMAGHEFERVWAEHRTFVVRGVGIPVARLQHIVESKALANRPKDQLFLATYRDALADLLQSDE